MKVWDHREGIRHGHERCFWNVVFLDASVGSKVKCIGHAGLMVLEPEESRILAYDMDVFPTELGEPLTGDTAE